jgi:predicted nucleotidyltransferase
VTAMFTVADRDRVRDAVLALADDDDRVFAAALVGSLAHGGGDRWSDLDLTFAVADDVPVSTVLEEWSERLARDFDALHLFDLPVGSAIYRVFLLPHGLQFDLSFWPASQFGANSPRFQLLFGATVEKAPAATRPAADIFGWAVAWARDARACIERGRPWQAEYAISAVRDHALELACSRRGLPTRFGRGFDSLPPEVLASFDGTLVRSLDRDELLRALEASIERVLDEATDVVDIAAKATPRIRAWFDA